MEIHKVICDRCGKETKMEKGNFYGYMLSRENWFNMENIDYCPKCARDYKKHREAFE